MHRETVELLGRCGISSEKRPFSADLPKVNRSATEPPKSQQGRIVSVVRSGKTFTVSDSPAVALQGKEIIRLELYRLIS